MKQKTTETKEITRESIFPSFFDKPPIKIKDMSLGYINNALEKMEKGYILKEYKKILQEERRLKFFSRFKVCTE